MVKSGLMQSDKIPFSYYNNHCVKSGRISNFSDPYFPAFGPNTEIYGVQENTDQKNSEYGQFSRSEHFVKIIE